MCHVRMGLNDAQIKTPFYTVPVLPTKLGEINFVQEESMKAKSVRGFLKETRAEHDNIETRALASIRSVGNSRIKVLSLLIVIVSDIRVRTYVKEELAKLDMAVICSVLKLLPNEYSVKKPKN